jgi:hypothetical protein
VTATARIVCVCGASCSYSDDDAKSVRRAAAWSYSHPDRRIIPGRCVRCGKVRAGCSCPAFKLFAPTHSAEPVAGTWSQETLFR